MQAQVKAWGNSQGIRIPKEVLQEAAVSVELSKESLTTSENESTWSQ